MAAICLGLNVLNFYMYGNKWFQAYCSDLGQQIDGLVQGRRNSSALAMELRLSCTKPSK